jgi:hypothetical protein
VAKKRDCDVHYKEVAISMTSSHNSASHNSADCNSVIQQFESYSEASHNS